MKMFSVVIFVTVCLYSQTTCGTKWPVLTADLAESEDDLLNIEYTEEDPIYLKPPISQNYEDIFESDSGENLIPNVITPQDAGFRNFGTHISPPDVAESPDKDGQSSRSDIPGITVDIISIDSLSKKIDNLFFEVKAQKDKISELENINKRLQDKIDLIEQHIKANNLIFTNVHETKYENFQSTLQKVLHIINSHMNVRVRPDDISVALRLDNNTTDRRPIVVQFTNYATKMRVLQAKNRLKRINVQVSAEYSEQVTKRRSELLPYMNEARRQGYTAFILYDKLVVNGVKKTLEELQAEAVPKDTSTECEISKKDPDEQVEEFGTDIHQEYSKTENDE